MEARYELFSKLSEQAIVLCERIYDAGTAAAEAKDMDRFNRINRVYQRADDRFLRRYKITMMSLSAIR